MPGRLLSQPHLLAHELRSPLTILAGWHSLIRDGDIDPTTTPKEWAVAMAAIQDSTDRLNVIIREACQELELSRLRPEAYQRFTELLAGANLTVARSREVLERVRQGRRGRVGILERRVLPDRRATPG
jgi:signal transduction histidine kinase